jgi:hypothetical protein
VAGFFIFERENEDAVRMAPMEKYPIALLQQPDVVPSLRMRPAFRVGAGGCYLKEEDVHG